MNSCNELKQMHLWYEQRHIDAIDVHDDKLDELNSLDVVGVETELGIN